ncbi:sulfurtransferase [Xanthomonas hyacinthi]|uniref:Sulfurtransferase n=1 Tax=Xanthomonas hyacinthi TaxID=56455 RepID=A0A2S7ERT6_9XANT|nr:sulfurtransferase [Xanthomonas hyacinthi]KLD78093.1 sulfurtransferase [Xanthomonas hyacinthi DSM 19077]PPU95813.1 sulfurtransferase [Xanthomonas hyacinthi]QGY75335.1 sulfurtransferase [Xanthomonas hyacinthi]
MSEPSPDWPQLVDAPTLAAALGHPDLRVVDARFALADPQAGRQGYAQSHLPGARYADLNTDLSDLGRRGLGRHPLPEADAFARTLGQWGIAPHTQVVVYDAGDGSMAAARLWWMLSLLGHRRVAVLDGGLADWRRHGLPETDAVATPSPLPPYPQRFDASRIADAEEIAARLHEAPGWLLDARAGERFRGEVEPIDPRAGHVPGALNRPLGANLRDGRLRPPQELRAELEPLLHGRDPREVVLMCGSGVTACHLLLALERAGLHGARVYAGSWSGWIADPARPRASG